MPLIVRDNSLVVAGGFLATDLSCCCDVVKNGDIVVSACEDGCVDGVVGPVLATIAGITSGPPDITMNRTCPDIAFNGSYLARYSSVKYTDTCGGAEAPVGVFCNWSTGRAFPVDCFNEIGLRFTTNTFEPPFLTGGVNISLYKSADGNFRFGGMIQIFPLFQPNVGIYWPSANFYYRGPSLGTKLLNCVTGVNSTLTYAGSSWVTLGEAGTLCPDPPAAYATVLGLGSTIVVRSLL